MNFDLAYALEILPRLLAATEHDSWPLDATRDPTPSVVYDVAVVWKFGPGAAEGNGANVIDYLI